MILLNIFYCTLFPLCLVFLSDWVAESSRRHGERDLWVSMSAVTVFCALQRVSDPQGSVRWDTCSPQHYKDGTPSTTGAHGGKCVIVSLPAPVIVSFVHLTLTSSVCRMMKLLCRGKFAQRCFSWRTRWPRSGRSMRCCASNLNKLSLPTSRRVSVFEFAAYALTEEHPSS